MKSKQLYISSIFIKISPKTQFFEWRLEDVLIIDHDFDTRVMCNYNLIYSCFSIRVIFNTRVHV